MASWVTLSSRSMNYECFIKKIIISLYWVNYRGNYWNLFTKQLLTNPFVQFSPLLINDDQIHYLHYLNFVSLYVHTDFFVFIFTWVKVQSSISSGHSFEISLQSLMDIVLRLVSSLDYLQLWLVRLVRVHLFLGTLLLLFPRASDLEWCLAQSPRQHLQLWCPVCPITICVLRWVLEAIHAASDAKSDVLILVLVAIVVLDENQFHLLTR